MPDAGCAVNSVVVQIKIIRTSHPEPPPFAGFLPPGFRLFSALSKVQHAVTSSCRLVYTLDEEDADQRGKGPAAPYLPSRLRWYNHKPPYHIHPCRGKLKDINTCRRMIKINRDRLYTSPGRKFLRKDTKPRHRPNLNCNTIQAWPGQGDQKLPGIWIR